VPLDPRAQLEAMGIDVDAPSEREDPKSRFKSVRMGAELKRILALPTRPIPDAKSAEVLDLARWLTEVMRRPNVPLYPGPFKAAQGCAVYEGWKRRGLVGIVRAGGGKMLIGWSLAELYRRMGLTRGVFITMGSMRPDTLTEWGQYAKCWHGEPLPIVSFEELQQPAAGVQYAEDGSVTRLALLDLMRPQFFIIDEAHKLNDPTCVAASRIKAYLDANPGVVMVCLTATPFGSSVKDAAHWFEWCLGDQSPLPRPSASWVELDEWAGYLDVRAGLGPKTPVGALLALLTEAELAEFGKCGDWRRERQIVRRAVARRILSTYGVIGTQEAQLVDADGRVIGLEVDVAHPATEDPAVEEAFKHLRGDVLEADRAVDAEGHMLFPGGRLPDGTVCADGFAEAAAAKDAGLGLWRQWEPAPPAEWRKARQRWSKWCRRALRSERAQQLGLDSESRVRDAVVREQLNDKLPLPDWDEERHGPWPREGALAAWQAQEAAYKAETGLDMPPSVVRWISDEAIDAAATWAREHGGLVWVDCIELGQAIADRLGCPYYQAGAKDARTKTHITKHRGGCAVASFKSCGTGKNLQRFWHKNLWLCTPGEQSMARTHRSGQKADKVLNWVYFGCIEHVRAYFRARDDKAEFQQDMTAQDQRLIYAEGELPNELDFADRGTYRWYQKESGE
jgi:hypothetical protein